MPRECSIGLVVLSMGGERMDTRNPTSKLMLTILAGVATWEREIMLERQREGIAKAKATACATANPPSHGQAEAITTLIPRNLTRSTRIKLQQFPRSHEQFATLHGVPTGHTPVQPLRRKVASGSQHRARHSVVRWL